MTDVPDNIEQWQNRAEDEAATALEAVHQGHNGYATDDRAAYAAVAQVHATLAVAAEIRAFSLRLEETMLDLHVSWTNRLDGTDE